MRDRVLERVREALQGRERPPPAPLAPAPDAESPLAADTESPPDAFERAFRASGGEVVRLRGPEAAREWMRRFEAGFAGAAQSPRLPPELRLELPPLDADAAPLGVSLALSAVAETGSLLLSGAEGRRLQLLPPVHLVWVYQDRVLYELRAALAEARGSGTAVLALHSGPSKSADIGRILVTGVHGPARVIAAVVEQDAERVAAVSAGG